MKRHNNSNGKKFDNKKRYNKKDEKKCDRQDYREPDERGSNDPAWYAQTPELLNDAASLPFSSAVGHPFGLTFITRGSGSLAHDGFTVPGIMTHRLIPVCGYANNPTSPLNLASQSLYSFIRHANSGSANYDAPDLMLYCLSMGQVYACINWLQRIYGCANLYSNYNRYLPFGLMSAQGVDGADIIQNLAQFRYGINSLIHKAASFAVPANLTYFRRLAFLFSNIYSEGDSIKSQMYMYTPECFMQFSETGSTNGGSLVMKPLLSGGSSMNWKAADLINYANELMQPLMYSEDIGIMSGDILKAYGTEGILKLAPIPELYVVAPVTNLEVLEQMQNLDNLGGFSRLSACSITQDETHGWLVSNLVANADSANFHPIEHILDTILVNPNPADVIERTRMFIDYTMELNSEGTPSTQVSFNCCTEFCVDSHVWTFDPSTKVYSASSIATEQRLSSWQTNSMPNLINMGLVSNFKFHPQVYVIDDSAAAPSGRLVTIYYDFDNYTLVSADTLARMNEAALLSLFNVPSIAKAY